MKPHHIYNIDASSTAVRNVNVMLFCAPAWVCEGKYSLCWASIAHRHSTWALNFKLRNIHTYFFQNTTFWGGILLRLLHHWRWNHNSAAPSREYNNVSGGRCQKMYISAIYAPLSKLLGHLQTKVAAPVFVLLMTNARNGISIPSQFFACHIWANVWMKLFVFFLLFEYKQLPRNDDTF